MRFPQQKGSQTGRSRIFAEEFKVAEENGQALRALSTANSSEAKIVRDRAANVGGGGGDPFAWHLNAVVVYASPLTHDWFFDTREFERLWYGLSARDAEFDAQLTYFIDSEAPCEEASETWIKLEELDRLVDQIIARLETVEATSNGLSLQNACPVDLMAPGQSCLDFFIVAETALLGTLGGNDRPFPQPYADISASKIFVVDDFDNNKVTLQLAGTPVGFSYALPSLPADWNFVKVAEFAPSLFMVDRLEVSAPDASTRVLSLSIKNAVCPYIQWGLQAIEPGMGEVFDMVCLNIDATFTYVRDARGWVPASLDRDAFPTVDVFRMNQDRTLEHLWRSGERHWTALTGFYRLKEKIQAAKDDTPIESGECELQ